MASAGAIYFAPTSSLDLSLSRANNPMAAVATVATTPAILVMTGLRLAWATPVAAAAIAPHIVVFHDFICFGLFVLMVPTAEEFDQCRAQSARA